MPNNDDFIFDMLDQAEKDSTDISEIDSSNIVFERDEQGNLVGYDKDTGKKVGRIYEHGNDKKNVAKTFDEIMRKE